MSEPLWVAPERITFKISPHHDLSGFEGGDWDLTRRHVFRDTAKYRAITEHYRDGRPWLETDLFRDAYARRLKRDGHVGRSRSLDELAADYDRRFDAMVEEMKRDGFRLASPTGKPHSLPVFLLGRDEVFIGNQGNHRLAIAQVLGLDRIAGKVICCHASSTRAHLFQR
jgi:hypothetical protein